MGSSVEYWNYAKQARAAAEGLKDAARRDRLLRIAAGWETMASDSQEITSSSHLAQHLPWPTD